MHEIDMIATAIRPSISAGMITDEQIMEQIFMGISVTDENDHETVVTLPPAGAMALIKGCRPPSICRTRIWDWPECIPEKEYRGADYARIKLNLDGTPQSITEYAKGDMDKVWDWVSQATIDDPVVQMTERTLLEITPESLKRTIF